MRFRIIVRVFVLLVIGGALGCSQATEEQCDKAFDHYFELKEYGIPEMIRKVNAVEFEEKRPRFLSQCVGRIKPSVITCWLRADTFEQLNGCETDNPILR
jgi:hypothetical protein